MLRAKSFISTGLEKNMKWSRDHYKDIAIESQENLFYLLSNTQYMPFIRAVKGILVPNQDESFSRSYCKHLMSFRTIWSCEATTGFWY